MITYGLPNFTSYHQRHNCIHAHISFASDIGVVWCKCIYTVDAIHFFRLAASEAVVLSESNSARSH